MTTLHTSSTSGPVSTIKEKCRMCYTCVRECPAKAIKIINGQAEIIPERCIACGNCIKVCSQGAKYFTQNIEETITLINSDKATAAIIAPSFPAEFNDIDQDLLAGMLKKLGFNYVCEVAFGADLIAQKYNDILSDSKNNRHYISSDCPAIVSYIEYFNPNLIDHLAPVISPMEAISLVIKAKYGKETSTVFIGPCIAKKQEAKETDLAITFKELHKLFSMFNIQAKNSKADSFDPPFANKGAIFPVERGLLQSIDMDDNILKANIVVAEGRHNFQSAIKEFNQGKIKNNHLELLCCEGCITGPGMTTQENRYSKQAAVVEHVKEKLNNFDHKQWTKDMAEFSKLDLCRTFSAKDKRLNRPEEEEITSVLFKMGKTEEKDHLDCGACGYISCREHAIAIIQGLAENEMCLPYTIEKMHNYINELALSNEKLASMQEALKHSEKLAHMGQLSAGIAHELNNPLGVVLMYANILLDECKPDSPMQQDLQLITEQAQRCKNIVGSLLNFARKNQLQTENTDIVLLAKKCINSIIIPKNIECKLHTSLFHPSAILDSDQMIQAISNLLKNAIDAMPQGGILEFNIKEDNHFVYFIIKDDGEGIPEKNMDKLYTPFFTTKGIGKGTGLGLPTTYGIIKMHKGSIEVVSNTDPQKGTTGTEFTVKIPKNLNL